MNRIFVAILLLMSCSLYVSAQSKPKPKPKTATPSASASIARGELVYKKYCLACHQADGSGVPNMNPPLSNTSYVKGDKVRLINTVLKGFPAPVDIDGESYTNVMPPHNFLKDQEIADVLTYVRNNFGNKGTAISLNQVKMVRAKK